jgi:hypothetical protein
LPQNIILGCQCKAVAKTLAFYETAIITTVKSFIVQVWKKLAYGNRPKEAAPIYVTSYW